MDGIFFTLQDFMTHTKGVIYVLVIVALLALLGFWQYLAENDED